MEYGKQICQRNDVKNSNYGRCYKWRWESLMYWIKRIKQKIRDEYAKKVDGYFFDNLIHISDNIEEAKRILETVNDIPTFNEIAEDNSNNYIFKNNKDELKIKILEIIKNERYEKKEIPSDEWKKQYNINTFAKSYLNIIK